MASEFTKEINNIRSMLVYCLEVITSKAGIADYFSSHGYKVTRENSYYIIRREV